MLFASGAEGGGQGDGADEGGHQGRVHAVDPDRDHLWLRVEPPRTVRDRVTG